MLSFWEHKALAHFDFIIVGAGIMGCSVAFELREKFPKASITVLERGMLPYGASTKNAGFTCFGSPTEILSDIQKMGEQKAIELIAQRYEGVRLLTDRIGSENLNKTNDSGYEIIFDNLIATTELEDLNSRLYPIFKSIVFSDVSEKIKQFGFQNVQQLLECSLESQIDAGMMMMNYWKLLREKNIQLFSGADVKNLNGHVLEVSSAASGNFIIHAENIILCTNAFINDLIPDIDVKPGRGQVILTNEIKDLPFKGSFHFDKGYYYFRNVGHRVLFGGGRNIDFTAEETTTFQTNAIIVKDLIQKLNEIILPDRIFRIEQHWQGIMGFSDTKLPVVLDINKHTKYVMACNGMGIALSPFVAQELVKSM